MLLEHGDVTVVIEMVVASRMTGRCTRWERWLPGSGGGLKELNWNLHSFHLLDIIQVLDSISWVRCASGDVFWHFPTNWPPTTLVPNKLLFWLHLFVPTLGFARQSKIGGGIKMQNDQSLIHGVAILSPIKL